MDAKVIDNALDFVIRAAEELWADYLTEKQQLKYSSMHLFEGIELLLKARLMDEHWSLIVRDADKYKADSFSNGDFQSVNYELTRSRLKSMCGVSLDEQTHQAFDALRRLRNRYVHFVSDEHRTSVMATQLKAWHHALRLLEEHFLKLSDVQDGMLQHARKLMFRSDEFLDARFREVQAELTVARGKGRLVVTCPTCGKLSLILGDGYPDCRVCAENQTYSEDVAEKYAAMNDTFWRHPRHGVDDDVAWCDACGEQACVPVGEDLKEEVERTLREKYPPQEPGEDFEGYLCFHCGEAVPDWFLRHCGSCGAKYFDSSDDRDRLCPACGRF